MLMKFSEEWIKQLVLLQASGSVLTDMLSLS